MVTTGQVYQDLRQRGPIPRQVKVVTTFMDGSASIRNTVTHREVWISQARLLNKSRFRLVSEIGALAPAPPDAVPA